MLSPSLVQQVATELSLPARSVANTLALFDEGNTLPFIARYRKEVTGNLDEVQLRDVRDRADYLRELEERRAAILKSIEEQGKLTDDLRARVNGVVSKQGLEDLYLPYKPKRRTRAMIARERGLEPLAELLWAGDADDAAVEAAAAGYVDAAKEVPAVADALQGARDILAERVAEDAVLRGAVREATRARGAVKSAVVMGKENEVSKFQDYYDFSERLRDIPSHRVLAIRRGEEEGFLVWSIDAPVEEIMALMQETVVGRRRAARLLGLVAQDAYKRLLAPSITVELRLELKTRADEEAIRIFGQNLEQLLLASPAGERVVIGLDPGFRTGVKVAVLSRTGAVVETDTWYLHQADRFAASLVRLAARHGAELIAIGNGTASRETEQAAKDALAAAGSALNGARPQVVVVNESGASVYSASDLAREELPDLDVSLRGAVSIARRLQDPLAELVKIDPKSIGVGQYQHDVNQPQLKRRLDEVVESCVNRVGVEVNTASVALLAYVAGVGPTLAQNIVKLRDERGGLRSRKDLLEVPRLGAKAFEQAAGFLRVRGGAHPLDASAVHPERYALVERIAADLGVSVPQLVGDEALAQKVEPQRYVSDEVGLPTLRDILSELRKPGRDPRESFELPAFRDDLKEPKDLQPGMVLEGVVTNIVAFGAFVDVGVHQDGLVHVSQLSDRYVADPNAAVRVGQKVRVTVMAVDLERNRIALSMKSKPEAAGAPRRTEAPAGDRRDAGRPDPRRAPRPAGRPEVKAPSFVPKSGAVAPNGIRFK
ncbi:Tex family protein [Roseisolibacter agri]|uniref:RNA-binding transcriptional accessory protein n=1 Tax=Roseisolibacter agri TaxID=2014610 RepID=A0AA37Q6Y7_9BACT|nr:Tex family protein [Roseisolibacter agri]GLC27680.1 RNA-binding transcriptional accessory protein [Roseisolibacter agri]